MKHSLSVSLKENIQLFHRLLPLEQSFDFITRDISLGNIACYYISINGMCDLDVQQRLFSHLQSQDFQNHLLEPYPEASPSPPAASVREDSFPSHAFHNKKLPDYIKDQFTYAQITFTDSVEEILHGILSGPSILLMDGYDQALIIDTRKYPSRSTQEPETEKVVKGAGDGFIEPLLTNCNLLRRRLRANDLVFSLHTVGSVSSTDVAVCYLENCCDKKLLHQIEAALDALQVTCLTMGIHSLKELLVKKSFFHPLPAFFLTSRPDVACSYLAEGYLLVIADNSPFAMVMPCNVFQFTQSPEDYYKSPSAGTYYRLLRLFCLLLSFFLLPLILYFSYHSSLLPPALLPLIPTKHSFLAVFIHLLFVELGLDLFKYASAHAASGYSSSLGLIGGLLIGDMAINLQWTSPQILFYGALTLLSGLAISTVELADTVKIYRIFLLLFIGFFPSYGLWIGLVLIFISLITTPTFGKKSYFWPLAPFSPKALKSLLLRSPTFQAQPEKKKSP